MLWVLISSAQGWGFSNEYPNITLQFTIFDQITALYVFLHFSKLLEKLVVKYVSALGTL